MESFSLVPGTPVHQLIFPRAKADPLTVHTFPVVLVVGSACLIILSICQLRSKTLGILRASAPETRVGEEGAGENWTGFFFSGFFSWQVRAWYALGLSRHHQNPNFPRICHTLSNRFFVRIFFSVLIGGFKEDVSFSLTVEDILLAVLLFRLRWETVSKTDQIQFPEGGNHKKKRPNRFSTVKKRPNRFSTVSEKDQTKFQP